MTQDNAVHETQASLLSRARGHTHKLVTAATVQRELHRGPAWIAAFNNRIAVIITRIVATMYCAYAFAMLAFVSLPDAIRSHSLVTLVSWISQTFLQLVLLSVIMVGQQVISASQDARAEADHETLTILHRMNITQLEILQELKALAGGQAGDQP